MDFFVLSFMTLLFHIFSYYRFICVRTNRTNIVTICPKLSAPQFLFHFWMESEKFLCSYAFQHLNNLFRRKHWYTLNQKVNMIIVRSYFNEKNFISFLYPQTNIFQRVFNAFVKNHPSILDSANNMIQQQTFIVALGDMFPHSTNVNLISQNSSIHPRSRAARYSCRIK